MAIYRPTMEMGPLGVNPKEEIQKELGMESVIDKMRQDSGASDKAMTQSVGMLGKAGIEGALSLVNNLYKSKVSREMEQRKAQQDQATIAAKTIQESLRQQQAGAVNPLRDLMAAYRTR